MRIVILGLSITSSWGNGHATTFRHLVRGLQERGHDVLFLERDVPWYASQRDLPRPPWCETRLYGSLDELQDVYADDAADRLGLADRVTFEKLQVYELAQRSKRYDIVWFMGVFYHGRYPLLALDILARKTKRQMIFQTLTMPGEETYTPPEDVPFERRESLTEAAWPRMAFIEKRLAGDPTNWWAASPSCIEAMLRSCGLTIVARPGHEIYLCEPGATDGLGIDWLKEEEYRAATRAANVA